MLSVHIWYTGSGHGTATQKPELGHMVNPAAACAVA